MFCVVSSVRVLEVADVWSERGAAPLFIYAQKTRESKPSLDRGSSRKINKNKAERRRDASKIHQPERKETGAKRSRPGQRRKEYRLFRLRTKLLFAHE